MGSSVTVFIKHNIDTYIMGIDVPASALTSLNFFAIIVGGSAVAWCFARIKSNDDFIDMVKFSMGLILLTMSFLLLFIAAKMATIDGSSSSIWIIVSLFLLGASELFIDPLALSRITAIPDKNTGFIVATYSLFTGSLASFLAAKVAQLSSFDQEKVSAIMQAKAFESFFLTILSAALIISLVWILLAIYTGLKHKRSTSCQTI
jgi:POT family proton-dependent oligopeptide transporter